MTDILTTAARLLAAQFRNKGGPLGAAAATIVDLLGEEGDPHEAGQAHPERGAPQPKDTSRSRVSLDRPKHDLNYYPGKGFIYSDHRAHDWRRAAEKAGIPDGSQSRFIPEGEVIGMARDAAAHRALKSAREVFLEGVDRRAARHPGYDTTDAGKDSMHNVSDDHHIDRSESTVHLSMVSGDQWLNGSQVRHRNCIGMQVNGPDGRTLCRVYMSFDQFAAFLTSNGYVPCTVADYWSTNESNVRLHERVRPVDTVGERLGRRIAKRIEEQFENILGIAKKLEDAAAAGKPVNKTLSAEMAVQLRRAADYTCQNLTFAADQAQEEVAGIVEQAAVHMSLAFGVNLNHLRAHPMLETLGVAQPRLPAPAEVVDDLLKQPVSMTPSKRGAGQVDAVGGIGPQTDGA